LKRNSKNAGNRLDARPTSTKACKAFVGNYTNYELGRRRAARSVELGRCRPLAMHFHRQRVAAVCTIRAGDSVYRANCCDSSSGRQPNCGVEQRAPRHLYSAGRPSRWAFAHISSLC